MNHFVSVIIATRDRCRLLAQTLAALGRQNWPRDRLEIIVADNGSTDSTQAVLHAAAGAAHGFAVRLLFVPEPGKSHAVNAALLAARGDILAFLDDDVLPAPNWIEALACAFDETGAHFIAGRTLPRWETGPPPWLSRPLYGVLAIADSGHARRSICSADSPIMPIGANMAVRREVIQRIGGLRTDLGKLEGTLRTGEDHEFFLRMLDAGFSGLYEPAAVVHHWVPRGRLHPSYFRRWMYQNGRDVARLGAAHPSTARRLLGVPRYLWREAAVNARRTIGRSLAADRAAAFAAALRVVWFMGFARETIHRRART
jgi:glycosyltransferase involved in cell wall biosynthesis